jgi:YesN/AraC family two-component response regulator
MYKLLLADDERIIREGISSIVDWNGMGISLIGVAKNGIEAYEVISANPPDIVLTDIKMPGMNGLELAKKIRDEYPDTAVVVLSGYGEFELARKAMEYGVKHYILKPCDKDEIIEVLKKILPEIENRKRKEDFARKIQSNFEKVIPQIREQFLKDFVTNKNYSEKHVELLEAFCSTAEESYRRNAAKYSDAVNKVIRYIEDNISDEELSLSSIAKDILFMDADYLGKLYKKETGEKFSQYVIKVRIEKAKGLIKSEVRYKTFEIAEKTGFGNNPQYFSQVFKKYTGYTPSEYKQFV